MILGSLASKRDSFFISGLVLICFTFFSFALHGQGIKGNVTEAFTHQPVANATLFISFADSVKHTVTTNTKGEYTWTAEKAGRATIEISAPGFIPTMITDVLVDGYSVQILSFALEKSSFPLAGVTVVASQNNPVPFVRTITPEDALRVAGNFEDPVQIAHSEPGIVLLNDQTNHLSARGQAPIFNTWYLEGLNIVNPNHTSNAGTLSDLPTQYGGGVNMFAAQTLGNTNIYMGVNPLHVNTNSGAAFDMHLHESAQPEWRAKAGLLGFELGGGTALGKQSVLDFNLRYSFTGLLTDFGADFGGEKIKYYDGVVSFRNEGEKHKLKLFAWAGRSTNEFDHAEDPEDQEAYKDFFDIDYGNDILGVGGTFNITLGPKTFLKSGLAYSENNSTYLRDGPFGDSLQFLFDRTYITGVLSAFAEVNVKHSSSFESSVGINYSDRHYRLSNASSTYREENSSIRSYLNTAVKLSPKWHLDLGLDIRYNSDSVEWVPGYRAEVNWMANEENTFFAGMRYGASDPYYSFANIFSYISLLSETFEVGWSYIHEQHQFGVNMYYQQMRRLEVYSLSSESISHEFIADYPNGQFAEFFLRTNNGYAQQSGIEGKWNYHTQNGWSLNLNQSVFHSLRGIKNETKQTGRYNSEFATHFAVSKEFLKVTGSKNKFWNISMRMLWNGGLRESILDPSANRPPYYKYPVVYSEPLPNYFRIDMGITHTIARSKIRWRYSLDIQNVFGITNIAYHYYDPYLKEIVPQNQLGLIPVLSVQASW